MAKKIESFEKINQHKVIASQIVIQKVFQRASSQVLDSFGLETFAVQQIRGMVEMLEVYTDMLDEALK